MMTVKQLMAMLSDLNPEASVTISINGALFDINGMGVENHADARSPRVVLLTGDPYSYSRGSRPSCGGSPCCSS